MDLKLDNKSQSFLKDLGTAERVVKSDWSTIFFCPQPSDVWSWCCVFWGPLHSYWDEHRSVPWKCSNKSWKECREYTESVTAGPLKYPCKFSSVTACVTGLCSHLRSRIWSLAQSRTFSTWLKHKPTGFERLCQFPLLPLWGFWFDSQLGKDCVGPRVVKSQKLRMKAETCDTRVRQRITRKIKGVNMNHEYSVFINNINSNCS